MREGEALILQKGENLGSVVCSEMLQQMKDLWTGNFRQIPSNTLFFKQQGRYNSLKNKASMRWHPAIIRCAYISEANPV